MKDQSGLVLWFGYVRGVLERKTGHLYEVEVEGYCVRETA